MIQFDQQFHWYWIGSNLVGFLFEIASFSGCMFSSILCPWNKCHWLFGLNLDLGDEILPSYMGFLFSAIIRIPIYSSTCTMGWVFSRCFVVALSVGFEETSGSIYSSPTLQRKTPGRRSVFRGRETKTPGNCNYPSFLAVNLWDLQRWRSSNNSSHVL